MPEEPKKTKRSSTESGNATGGWLVLIVAIFAVALVMSLVKGCEGGKIVDGSEASLQQTAEQRREYVKRVVPLIVSKFESGGLASLTADEMDVLRDYNTMRDEGLQDRTKVQAQQASLAFTKDEQDLFSDFETRLEDMTNDNPNLSADDICAEVERQLSVKYNKSPEEVRRIHSKVFRHP